MKKKAINDKAYSTLLKRFELPLVFSFAKENKPKLDGVAITTIPSEFYQSDKSVLYEPTKPISKIFK
jgi:hypothetical protein